MAEQRNGTPPGPEMERSATRKPTTERLRSDIDEGRARDKVDYPDPATAPLGTDAEAGGAPPSPGSVAGDRQRTVEREGPREDQRLPRGGRPWLIWAITAVVVIAGIAMYYGFA